MIKFSYSWADAQLTLPYSFPIIRVGGRQTSASKALVGVMLIALVFPKHGSLWTLLSFLLALAVWHSATKPTVHMWWLAKQWGHRERRGICKGFVGKLEVKRHLWDTGIDGRIILRWVFWIWCLGVLSGSSWFRIGTVQLAFTCECGNEALGYIKCREFLE
jgi:hypothetical protein